MDNTNYGPDKGFYVHAVAQALAGGHTYIRPSMVPEAIRGKGVKNGRIVGWSPVTAAPKTVAERKARKRAGR